METHSQAVAELYRICTRRRVEEIHRAAAHLRRRRLGMEKSLRGQEESDAKSSVRSPNTRCLWSFCGGKVFPVKMGFWGRPLRESGCGVEVWRQLGWSGGSRGINVKLTDGPFERHRVVVHFAQQEQTLRIQSLLLFRTQICTRDPLSTRSVQGHVAALDVQSQTVPLAIVDVVVEVHGAPLAHAHHDPTLHELYSELHFAFFRQH
ncbi:hypothetical protein EYF80_039087 [Liparis tanakae]|uniref:Uncharacterized protein n=1 Tax=Liparis tanakae TaxID=230148 RepID=A0A4Z2GAW6_9TELE|nr:hypothetical protein EYF80_039087 [Liparis tanakae]